MIEQSLPDLLTKWLPPYTEQWATTYLQVLFQSFLFALGVPTAIYSLIVDHDIKRVAQTRVKARRYFLATALLYVAAFIIVWFLHPEPSASASHFPEARQEAVSTSQKKTPTPTSQIEQSETQVPERVSDTQSEQTAPRPGPNAMFKSIFAAFTVTFLPFAVLITGLRLNSQFKRQKVVDHLASELLRSLDADRNIDTIVLKDLSYLGEHGQAGDEKEIVLNVIDRLAETVQVKVKANVLRYSGYELESLIRHIPAMLDNNAQPGNDQNYRRAVEVLANIWRWLGARTISDDALSTREALRHLALRSVERTAEDTALAYLEIAADCDSHMVFDMGLAAIRSQKYTLATAALTKLEAMSSNALAGTGVSDVGRETRSNLLGIAAYLAAEGPSGSIRAETSLRLNQELFWPSLRQVLADASDYHYDAGRFDTADKIRMLVAEAGKMETVDLDRAVPCIAATPEPQAVPIDEAAR
jgi:hypothetical protein